MWDICQLILKYPQPTVTQVGLWCKDKLLCSPWLDSCFHSEAIQDLPLHPFLFLISCWKLVIFYSLVYILSVITSITLRPLQHCYPLQTHSPNTSGRKFKSSMVNNQWQTIWEAGRTKYLWKTQSLRPSCKAYTNTIPYSTRYSFSNTSTIIVSNSYSSFHSTTIQLLSHHQRFGLLFFN